MAVYQSFEELPIWNDSRALVKIIYDCTRSGPFSQDYGLRDQIQRASVSTMTNIAEGFERRSSKEFCQFLNYAKASSGEVRSLIYVALDLGYISEDQFDNVHQYAVKLSKSITGFDRYLSQSNR